MLDLQQDLIDAQRAVTAVLADYERASEDVIKSNYTAQLHLLLDCIAAFDHARLKDCELASQDETAARYIQAISDKIKSAELPKAPPPAERASKSVDRAAPKEAKRESWLGKEEGKRGGIFDFVRNKFTSKEKKATEMIFPEEEPKCYYDPVTKSYVFEGEEPEVPKAIQKPPSAAAKKFKQEIKKPASEDSELGQLTAPPAFKRKSTQGTNLKGKVKVKQQTEVVREVETVTFAKVMETINESYKAIVEKAKNGAYERHVHLPQQNASSMAQFISFTERTLQASEEISTHEHKLIQKWGKLLTSESRELKIMEKVIKQIGESAQTYTAILSKLEAAPSMRERQQRVIREEVVVVKEVIKQVEKDIIKEVQKEVFKEFLHQKEGTIAHQSSQTSLLQSPVEDAQQDQTSMQREIQELNRKYYALSLKFSDINEQKQRIEHLAKRYQAKIDQLEAAARDRQSMITYLTNVSEQSKQGLKEYSSSNEQLSLRVKKLADELKIYQERQKRIISEHSHELAKLTQQFKAQIQRNITEISELECANYSLQQEKNQLCEQLKQAKTKKDSSIDKVTSQIAKQKSKIQSQLKFYEQKQRMYISSLQNLQDQSSLMQEYEFALCQENQILNCILEKRLQLSRNPQSEDAQVYVKHQQEQPSHLIILQLSDIVNSITETHLDRLEAYNRYYAKLHRKYLDTKEALSKIKSNAANENMSLSRNVTRLKGLLETYKTAKEEAEERASQLELQCDKLKKKLLHYKEEDQFNKSYLSRLKTSKIHSQNESVLSLQEDKEELASEIEELRKEVAQKEEVIRKNQNDLEDLLINYEKNQTRLLQIQKRFKQNEKELRQAKQQLEYNGNYSKLLELQLQNIKGKHDQLQIKEQARVKNAESALEKKIKLIKKDLEQANKREEHLRAEIEELRQQYQLRLHSLQESHSAIVSQLNSKITEKDNENSQIIILLDQTSQKLEIEQDEKESLLTKHKQLVQIEKDLNVKLSEVIDEHLKEIAIHNQSQSSLNSIIQTLVQRYNSLKDDQESFQSAYNQKIYQLEQALEASFEDSRHLLTQIEQYSQLLQQSRERFEQMKEQSEERRNLGFASEQYLKKIEDLEQLVSSLQGQLKQNKEQSQAFQQIIEKMSQDMARLTANEQQLSKDRTDLVEKLMYRDRQLETLSNEVNKKSEQLMVKTEELLEKDGILLEQEEISVMRKEELDEVKNQLLKLSGEVRQRDQQIRELTADLQELAGQLASDGDGSKQVQDLNAQICQLRQSAHLKDQEITNFAENSYKLSLELEQKSSEAERLNAVVISNTKQIQQLKNAILEISASLEDSQDLAASLQRQNGNRQAIINGLQAKLSQKEAELALLLERLSAAEKEISRQIGESDEIEGEMEYLLKEISTKESELEKLAEGFRLRNFEYDEMLKKHTLQQTENQKLKKQLSLAEGQNQQLASSLEAADAKIHALQKEVAILSSRYEHSAEENKKLAEEKLALQSELVEKDNQKRQLAELIGILEKQKEASRESTIKSHENAYSQIKEEGKLIEELLADIKAKEEAIINGLRQVQQKEQALRHLREQLQLNEELIRETKRTVTEKSRLITEAQIAEQEKLRIIVELQKSLKESEERYSELESNLAEMADVIESQEGLIQSLKNEAAANDTSKVVEGLSAELRERKGQNTELKRKLQQLKGTFALKEGQYEKKIQTLERDNIGTSSLKNACKKLQESLKGLEEENKLLTNEKVELMKSNNYLVGINQKLIADKSPHNSKEPLKAHPAPPSEKTVPPQKAEPQQPAAKQSKQGKKETSGIFGALSSLFLTPTETDRMRK